MKLALTLALALFATQAYAFESGGTIDPRQGSYEKETQTVQKSATANYSMAISKGHALYLSENEVAGGYIVSRFYSGTGKDAASAKLALCIADRAVPATGTSPFRCITRGYVDFARYDATTAIVKLDYLCPSTTSGSEGVLVKCDAGVVSKFIALEAKASGTGTNLKVLLK